MKQIDRYDFVIGSYGDLIDEKNKDGEYVKYEDFKKFFRDIYENGINEFSMQVAKEISEGKYDWIGERWDK
jgi:hypothetical protein